MQQFTAEPIPKPSPDDMRRANQGGTEWAVSLSVIPDAFSGCAGPAGGVVRILPFDDVSSRPIPPFPLPPNFPAPTSILRVDNGFLIGADQGGLSLGIELSWFELLQLIRIWRWSFLF